MRNKTAPATAAATTVVDEPWEVEGESEKGSVGGAVEIVDAGFVAVTEKIRDCIQSLSEQEQDSPDRATQFEGVAVIGCSEDDGLVVEPELPLEIERNEEDVVEVQLSHPRGV